MVKGAKLCKTRHLMKHFLLVSAFGILLFACQEPENKPNDFTGHEATYPLHAGSDYAVHGFVTFKERKDGSVYALVQLNGTSGNFLHPVHLHLGDIGTPDAEIALLLNPVESSSGHSETVFQRLADETPVNYSQLIAMYASVKIHLAASGPERDIILAGGNIGTAFTHASGRANNYISVCKSE